MTKINYFQLDQSDLGLLHSYFRANIHNKKKSVMDLFVEPLHKSSKNKVIMREIIVANDRNSCNIYKDLVIQIALKYLEKFGYKTADLWYKNYFIELFQYSCIGAANKVDPLDYHEDDYAVMQYKVNTIIFYLTKSDSLIGGDLEVDINGNRTIIPIQNGMAIAFEGNLVHKPTVCTGYGLRECIVVQLQRQQ